MGLFDDDIFDDDLGGTLPPEFLFEYHFYDRLLPFAIKSKRIRAKELIDLWAFVQYYGKDVKLLWKIIVEANEDLSFKICCAESEESYTEDDVVELLKVPINYMKGHNKDLIDYRKNAEKKEPKAERALIEKYQDELYHKFVPSNDTAQLRTLWEEAERKNQIELMCYYYFLNKYITQYAKKAVMTQNNWPKMVELKENPLPQYEYNEILNNLNLLRGIVVNMGYDKTTFSLSDIMGIIKILKDVVPIIKENKIL